MDSESAVPLKSQQAEVKKTKIRRSVKYFFIPTFLLFFTYYFFIDILNNSVPKIKSSNIIYVLQWTAPDTEPFKYMGVGQNTFLERGCPVNNCYVTHDRFALNDVSEYDVILFHGPEIHRKIYELPADRSKRQIYVFVSMESSHYYPIKEPRYDGYFNWTWTYKLNSDVFYGYLIIRNTEGTIIGPKENMNWLKFEDMKPIDDNLKNELSTKSRAAAWFVSNCETPSKREQVVKNMQKELSKYNMKVDIYGRCGENKCDKSDEHCTDTIKKNYFFYLSFENSFSEDYVTEKLLTALQNNAVPVVYGGANYTRFLPDGAYLDARKLDPKSLVERMMDAINNTQTYNDFFRWRNHYSYYKASDSTETDYYCKFCSQVNQIMKSKDVKISYYAKFRKWWNNPS
ncbi:alpha-(1,3)-fucosyltransferase C-like [Anticarsia gemmatalis]|uniref:alpha-(1,3)-fucosyltransferase C-like n=1 Tax=Anticarsia gemmatalis TaxID=129554 RepID=UPI003F775A9B